MVEGLLRVLDGVVELAVVGRCEGAVVISASDQRDYCPAAASRVRWSSGADPQEDASL
jgi:hypothetical protein